MPIEAGRTLLHYRLVEKIGEGGMGVVWRAEDTTLDRDVAIKVLPEVVAADPERLARFEREAKLLAALEHPNIASVYGLHEVPSTTQPGQTLHFLAMEYVRGEDLSKRLARGPLPTDEALLAARQVAEALEGAHAKGIIHRDLKPANIVLTPEGKIKVLDFGLAKAFEVDATSGTNPSLSPTLTSAGTIAGVILGTAAYMSPEQARGHTADKRSDIWAFGCVLFEMLTQGQIFRGGTVSDTLASVLKSDPEWDRLPENLPGGIRRLLRRCLQKDPRVRLHDAADARIEIDETIAAPEMDAVPEAFADGVAAPRRRPWLAPILALLALAAGLGVGWGLRPQADAPPMRRFVISGTDMEQELTQPRISPDGRRIAYIAAGQLQLRDLDQFEARTVEDSDGARAPFWSPDSTHVAYLTDGKLWKVAAGGGPPTRICDTESTREGVWGDDETITLLARRSVHRVSARGGDIETIFEANRTKVTDYHGFDLLPGGGLVVAVHDAGSTNAIEIWVGDEHERLLVLTDTWIEDPRWVEAGYITFTRERTNEGVWALPFSPSTGEATGEAFLVTPDGSGATVSDDGTMIHVAAAGSSDAQLVWISAEGEVGRAIGQSQEGLFVPRLSPDGTGVLVTGQENGEWDIWIHDVTRGSKTRLTFLDGTEGSASWSPDGRTVFFHHPLFGETPSIYTVPSDGRGDPSKLVDGGEFTLSNDGKQLVFVRDHEEMDDDLWTVPVEGGAEPKLFLRTAAIEDAPRFSPDGRFLAYESDESGRDEIYVEPFPSSEGKWQVSVNGGRDPAWSRDGTRLYYSWQDTLFRVRVETDRGLTLSTPEKLFEGSEHRLLLRLGYDVGLATDPERFIVIQRLETEKDETPVNGIFVIENWLGDP